MANNETVLPELEPMQMAPPGSYISNQCDKSISKVGFAFGNVDFYRTQVNLGSDLCLWMSVSTTPYWDLTDMTLADEDANLIIAYNANMTLQGNLAIQVAPASGQI